MILNEFLPEPLFYLLLDKNLSNLGLNYSYLQFLAKNNLIQLLLLEFAILVDLQLLKA